MAPVMQREDGVHVVPLGCPACLTSVEKQWPGCVGPGDGGGVLMGDADRSSFQPKFLISSWRTSIETKAKWKCLHKGTVLPPGAALERAKV